MPRLVAPKLKAKEDGETDLNSEDPKFTLEHVIKKVVNVLRVFLSSPVLFTAGASPTGSGIVWL